MLVNFRFKNCRSFYDEAVLSMRAASDTTYRELNTFFVEDGIMVKNDRELIKSALIFGGNASGKSNLLKAFAYMAGVIRLSSAQIPIVASNEFFAFMKNAENENSLYEVEIVQSGTFYRYGFELCKGTVKKEWLYKRESRLSCVFERIENSLKIHGENSAAIALIKVSSSALFLSIGNNFKLSINQYLSDVIKWFNNALIVFENSNNALDIYTMENGKYRAQAIEILKRADIGITDFTIIKDKIATAADPESLAKLTKRLQSDPSVLAGQLAADTEALYNIDMKTVFNVFDENDSVVGKKEIMLFKDSGFNSEGTIRLLCYLGWILAALEQGRVIFIDEIDSKLHFLVADHLIKLFNSIENNRNNAQLICTAHNVMLMDDGLRRDQIYFASKDERGRSSLVSLADYQGVRKTDLFSKRYLAGFYASIPDLKNDWE